MTKASEHIPLMHLNVEEKTFTTVYGGDGLVESILNPEILTSDFLQEYYSTFNKLNFLLSQLNLGELSLEDDEDDSDNE